MDEIVNKVAQSKLQVFDLEDYYPEGRRMSVDIAQWLTEGFILREKDFRDFLKLYDWAQYQSAYVNVFCSTGAIIPTWASILVTLYLAPYARKVVSGTSEDLETALYQELLPTLDYSKYNDLPIIIKGCSRKPVPMAAYVLSAQHLQPFAKSIMYGEACSAVPLYKKR